ncbi:MAG: potassium channel family protein [Anaerofustis sp.]
MDAASVWMKLLKGCYFSTITFFTIGYGDVLPANAWSAVLSGAEGFVGVVLMSYFTVALVRKLLR